jgi:hypothetical protein
MKQLTVADVAVMPEKKAGILANPKFPNHKPGWNPYNEGYNDCRKDISSLPISKDKVIGIIEFDREKLAKIIFDADKGYGPDAVLYENYRAYYFGLADAIISALPKLWVK